MTMPMTTLKIEKPSTWISETFGSRDLILLAYDVFSDVSTFISDESSKVILLRQLSTAYHPISLDLAIDGEVETRLSMSRDTGG